MFIEFKKYIDRKTTLFLKTAILGVGYQNGALFLYIKAAKANFCSFLETWRMGELRPAESYLLMEEIPNNHRKDV